MKDLGFEKRLQKEWESNYKENSKYFDKFVDLSFFQKTKRLDNIPSVLVLSGPSTDNHIQELKKIRKKVLVMACDTVVFRLNEENIIPDFIVSIDPQKDFLNLLTKDIDKNPYLIIPTSGSSLLVKEWQGYIFFFNQTDADTERKVFFKKLIKPTKYMLTIENKFFVGMTMFQIALLMGLHPITFLGADFCYTDHWYVRGLEEKRYEGKHIEPNFDDEVDFYKTTKIFHFYRDTLKMHVLDIENRKHLKIFSSSDGILSINKINLEDFAKKYGKDRNISYSAAKANELVREDRINIKEIVKLKVSVT